jgi:hypothetical protein
MNKNNKSLKKLGEYLILLFMLSAMGLASCVWDEIPPPEIPNIPEDSSLSFSNDIVPIFESSCAVSGCHDGTWKPNLTANVAYDQLTTGGYINSSTPSDSKLYMKIDGGSMQQYATDEDRYLILRWITEGAEDN